MRHALLLALLVTGCSTSALRSSCIGAGLADAGTTAYGMAQGAKEANPLLSPAPAALSLGLTAVTILAADHLRKTGHETAARWLYGGCALLHGSASLWNGKELSK